MYIIYFTDIEKSPIFINEKDINTTELSISLIGKDTAEYGVAFDENVLHLLENFAAIESELNPGNPEMVDVLSGILNYKIEGQFWFNKTDSRLYFFDNTEWIPLINRNETCANSGIIVHGQHLPRPVSEDGYIFEYSECTWFVSPQYIDQHSNYIECYTDVNGLVYARYRSTITDDLIEGVANYLIMGIKDSISNNIPFPLPSVPLIPSPTPTPSVTISIENFTVV